MPFPESRPVYISAAAVLNAAGHECSDLYGQPPSPQFLPFDLQRQAYPVTVPELSAHLFDRKVQRSVESQGRRALYCAERIAAELDRLNISAEKIALMAAFPEVDAPSPCWDAVQAIAEQPDQILPHLLHNTPPLHALTLLNSNIMGYIAEALACKGPMGGFCSQGNAGLDALIEAYQQIVLHHADAALVVSSSPNLTPALFTRPTMEPMAYKPSPLYGEGAAALLLTCSSALPETRILRIAGFSRGFCAVPERTEVVAARVIQQVLRAECLSLNDVEQIIVDTQDPIVMCHLADYQHLVFNTLSMTGDLGASALLTEIAAVLHGATGVDHAPRYILLVSHNALGFWGALLLASEITEGWNE